MATIDPLEIHDDALMILDEDIDNSQTTFDVQTLVGITTGTTNCVVTVISEATYGNDPRGIAEVKEQMLITGVSTLTLTVVRDHDGAGAVAFDAGAIVEIRVIAEQVTELQDAVAAGTEEINVSKIRIGDAGDPVEELDVNGSGNISGDFDVEGEYGLGATGVNKIWTKFVPASDMALQAASPPAAAVYENGEAIINVLDFDKDTSEFCGFTLDLGEDYDGSPLLFRVYWTASAGTTGDVEWQIEPRIADNDEALGGAAGAALLTDTFIAQNDLHVIAGFRAPDSAGTGQLLSARLRRNATSGGDTFDADARLIGVGVSY